MLNIIQISRALAALAVCAFHMSIVFEDPRFGGRGVFRNLTSQGYIGVDFFFALSGFIILYAHKADINQAQKIIPYFIKRFIRIFPLYWLVSAAVLVGSFSTGGINNPPRNFLDSLSLISLIHFSNFDPPVHAAWTLFHEIFFYLLFAFAIYCRSVGVCILTSWFLFLILGPLFFEAASPNTFFQTVAAPVNISFYAGIAAFFAYKRITKKLAFTAFMTGLGLFAAWLTHDWTSTNQMASKASLAMCFFLILSGGIGIERFGTAFNSRFLKLLGDASFALYLTHESAQSLGLKLISKFYPKLLSHSTSVYALIFLLSILFALALYFLVEKPLIAWLREVFFSKKSDDPHKQTALGLSTAPVPTARVKT